MRGGALRYYRPQGQLGRGFGGLLKHGLKRGLQLQSDLTQEKP